MKALHFFNPNKKTGKFFMILLLSRQEQDALDQAGGFDKAIGSEGWIGKSALRDSLKFLDRSAYVFRGYREQLDFIWSMLKEKLGFKYDFKNILDTPTFAELLAFEHKKGDTGVLNLYIDTRLPLQQQRRRMLWATYRPRMSQKYYEFQSQCRGSNSYVQFKLLAPEVIVTLGFYQSGYVFLQRYLNQYKGFSMTTNVLDYEDYPRMLLKSFL